VHAPIGIDIGAVTPAEIAVSILAELIAIRHGTNIRELSMSSQRRARRPARKESATS